MAVTNEDLARLVVTLDADVTKMYNGLKRAQQQTNTTASGIEKRLTQMSSSIDRTFANLGQRMSANLTGPLAGIGAAFSTVEIIRYADAWTVAANKVAAAGDIVGIQARPLRELRELADQGRSSFEDTIQLYSRMLRAAGGVASSELEIARATDIVNKAFKAGGAATSEMQAGILQLSQGLSSGVLQGDELRSVRENAPVLAQVMADYFNTTIGGLKELGSQGKLTSDLVFKAILSGEDQIESAFSKTNRTIAESFQLVQNRLIEYIGTADQTVGATATITQALTFLADNFDQTADVVLKLAAVIAGALLGRSILGMVGGIGSAIGVLRTLNAVMREATTSGAKFGAVMSAAFGPLALIIGGVAAVAFQELSSQSIESAASINQTIDSMQELGVGSVQTAKEIRDAAMATEELTEAQRRLREAEQKRSYERAVQNESDLRGGTLADNLRATAPVFETPTNELVSAFAIAQRAARELDSLFSGLTETERLAVQEIRNLAEGLRSGSMEADAVRERILAIQETPGLSDKVIELSDVLDRVAIQIDTIELAQIVAGGSQEVDSYSESLANALSIQTDLAYNAMEFASDEQEIAFRSKVDDLIEGLREGTLSATQVQNEINALSSMQPAFAGIVSGLAGLIGKFFEASAAARNLKILTNSLSINNPIPTGGSVGEQNFNDRRDSEGFVASEKALDDLITNQKDYNSLSSEERDIRDEIARIMKGLPDEAARAANTPAGQERIRALAAENLALKAADREAKKKDKGSDKAAKDAQKFFEDLSQEERANELLQEELLLRQGLNPLINDYGLALERAKKEQELLVAAEEAGVALTPEIRERIAAIAELYATTTAEIEKATEAQDKLKQTVEEWTDITKSATRSFIDDLIEGKSAAEAFGNVLQQIGSKLIDFGLESLFNGGGGLGGGIGGIIGSFFGLPGRVAGGPVSKGHPYIVGEKRPEVFVPDQNGVIIPRVPNNMGSSSVNAPVSIQIDATGADSAGLARLQTELVKIKAEIPYIIKHQVSQRNKKGW